MKKEGVVGGGTRGRSLAAPDIAQFRTMVQTFPPKQFPEIFTWCLQFAARADYMETLGEQLTRASAHPAPRGCTLVLPRPPSSVCGCTRRHPAHFPRGVAHTGAARHGYMLRET